MPSVSAPRALAVLTLPLALAVTLAACGSDASTAAPVATSTPTTQLNTQTVASAIKKSIKDQRKIKAHVVCPQSIEQKKGNNFVCQASTKDGTVTPFAVQQVDDAGHVTYAAATSAATTPTASTP